MRREEPEMEAKATMRPGQRGTRKLVARFGDRLICVRYRYDAQRRKRFTTVELIVDEADWHPPTQEDPGRATLATGPALVGLRVEMRETGLQRKVKAAGDRWDREQCLWLLPLDRARELGLEQRIATPAIGKKVYAI
jgi:hypothetical protein